MSRVLDDAVRASLDEAVRLLQAGELVAFPTETVYGLGADAANPEAVAKIFAAKGRPADHPVIVHLPGAAHIERWAVDIPQTAWDLAEAFWPGPLTLILKRAPATPLAVTGGQETVGLRAPAHPLALALLRAYAQAGGGRQGMCGIAAPSANRFGRISPTDAAHVREELGDAVSLVLDGGVCDVGIESTIIDLSNPNAPLRILRPGHITPAQIAAVIGIVPEIAQMPGLRAPSESGEANNTGAASESPRAPGMLAAHYAPRTPLRVVATAALAQTLAALHHTGQSAALIAHSSSAASLPARSWCLLPDEAEGFARGLYAALRTADREGCDVIVVEAVPDRPEWAAVADRIRRAAVGSCTVEEAIR